jgi:hypothetical protein
MTNGIDLKSGRVLGPLGVGFVLVVMVVIARGTAADPSATPSTLDFTSGTSVTLATTTTTPAPAGEATPASRGASLQAFLQAPGWRSLSGGDLRPRTGFATVWTDDRFVVWGGVDFLGNEVQRQGAPYRSDGWQEMEQSPIVAGVDPVLVWTGRELFAYSGAAAAWNPNTNTWRTLAYPPTGAPAGGGPIAGVWADNQVILVGYRTHPPVFDDNLFVASYGPDLGCCDVLPEPPFSLSHADAFWTGQEMLLIGALVDAEGEPMTDDGLGRFAGFDPNTGTWTEYDPPPLPQADRISAAWTGAAVVAWDARLNAAEWTKERGWRTLPDVPLPQSDCRPQSTAISDTEVAALDRNDVVAVLCGKVAIWDAEADRWFSIVGPQAVTAAPTDACGVEGSLTWPIFYLWCSGNVSGSFFWQVDSSAVEASQYSEPATLSQWELLPNPAATRLDSTTIVGAGNELFYFSGQGIEVEEFGGWGYDPDRNIMRGIPDAPSPGRSGQVALWTSEGMLVWRGPTTLWNPITLEWRTAEQSPALGASPFAVWAGDEAIFYGSRTEPSNTGAAYNPDTDTWRPIATAPVAVAVGVQVMAWSGEGVYVFGNWSVSIQAQSGAVYDPASDSWRPLPPIPAEFTLSGTVGGFVNGQFVVIGVNGHPLQPEGDPLVVGLAYSPDSDEWRTIAPIRQPETASTPLPGSMAATAHRDELAVYLAGGYYGETTAIAFYNPSTDTWRYIDGAPASAPHPTMVSGDTFIAYLTSAGTVLLHDG